MEPGREQTCCFTGHRPAKLPWGEDERDPRCVALKRSMARELEALYCQGWRRFLSGMAQGADLYFAEAVLELREKYPPASLEGVVPCRSQADRWPAAERARWRAVLDAADARTLVQQEYDKWCMLRRDRLMVERSSLILAVFDGSAGGTKYTLDCAASQGLTILLLDPRRPEAPATRLERKNIRSPR